MKELFKQVVSDLDISRAVEHVKWLCENIPQRLAGSEDERRAVEYFSKALRSYGVDTKVDEFDGLVSFPGASSLTVIAPEPFEVMTQTYAQIQSTPPEGIEAELIYIERGIEEDFEGLDVRGKIMLTSLGSPPWRPEKVRVAMKNGVAGQIQINTGPKSSTLLPMGTVKAVWGNPTPSNYADMPTIPVVGISAENGERLKAMCAKGPVRVRMVARAEREWRMLQQPVGWLQGQSDEFMLVVGHFDSWGGGCTCNAVGNGALLELARVFAKHKQNMERSIMFCMFTGHETGMSAGSSYLVDKHWDDLDRAVACTIIDSVGLQGGTTLLSRNTPEIMTFLKAIEKQNLTKKTEHIHAQRVGDHTFYGVGIPTIFALSVSDEAAACARSKAGENWGLSLGWWYHSVEDTFDKMDKNVLLEDITAQAAYIAGFCNTKVPPYEYVSVCEMIRERLQEVNSKASHVLPLDDLIEEVESITPLARVLCEKVEQANSGQMDQDTVMLLSECQKGVAKAMIPVLKTLGGRYAQDPYGLMATQRLLPGLEILADAARRKTDDIKYKLNFTQAMRERNRIADAIRYAHKMIADTIKAV